MIKGSASRRAAVVRRITGVCGIISQLIGLTALQMTWGLLSITAGVLVEDGFWGYAIGESYPVGA